MTTPKYYIKVPWLICIATIVVFVVNVYLATVAPQNIILSVATATTGWLLTAIAIKRLNTEFRDVKVPDPMKIYDLDAMVSKTESHNILGPFTLFFWTMVLWAILFLPPYLARFML